MAIELSPLEVLVQFPGEVDASIIVNALETEGIKAALTGVNTASFRAEAPGLVSVMVRRDDVDRARQVLEAMQSGKSDTDWENVDVGEPE